MIILQIALAAGVLVYVLWLVDWESASGVLVQADICWLFAAFGASMFGLVPAALRWTTLLQAINIHYSTLAAYRAYLTGSFYSLAMPSVIGGDAARIWLCVQETKARLTLVATTVVMERGLGVVALLLIVSLGVQLYPFQRGEGFFLGVLALALAFVGSIVALPSLLRRYYVSTLSSPLSCDGRVRAVVHRVLDGVSPFHTVNVGHLSAALLLSVFFQFADILATYAIVRALDLALNFQILLIAMPTVYLATVLPITPGGLGIREGTLVIVLAQFGLPASDAALLALSVFLNRVAVGIVGGVQHMAGGGNLSQVISAVKK